ncbi:MAG: metallophosphoesterase [Clostridia bacterium]|nr:metallophosphoesterase [Clostridia bacterium]
MNGDSKQSTKMKIVISVIFVVVAVLAIVLVNMFGPDPMPVDWSKVQYIPSNVVLLEAGAEHNPSTENVALVRYNEDEKIDNSDWKVLQFSDMHLTQADDRNEITLTHFIDAIRREKPDFVVLTGDIITRPLGRARAVQLAEIFEKMNVYWCFCLGNHEGDSAPFTLTREENIRIWSKYPHCLVENDVKKTQDGTEVWGLGNTVVNLLGADYKVDQSMIFMDSGGKVRDAEDDEALAIAKEMGADGSDYDFLKSSQLKWYEEQVNAVTENLTNGVKTMLFIHIPLVEQSYVTYLKPTDPLPLGWHYDTVGSGEETVYNKLMVNGEVNVYAAVKDGWTLVGDTASYEKCYCSFYNNGMYDLMKSLRKGVNGLFCGHDHLSNSVIFETALEGDDPVYLCYGICSGLQSYNLYDYGMSEEDDYHLRGYNVITIKGDSTFDLHNVRYNDVDHPITRVTAGVAID